MHVKVRHLFFPFTSLRPESRSKIMFLLPFDLTPAVDSGQLSSERIYMQSDGWRSLKFCVKLYLTQFNEFWGEEMFQGVPCIAIVKSKIIYSANVRHGIHPVGMQMGIDQMLS